MVFPAVSDLWERWWQVATVGRACGVLQYASVLMYPDDRNPIFAPRTPHGGGGPPVLWETDAFCFDYPWLPANVAFLRARLAPAYVRMSITAAATVLREKLDCPVPEQMLSDFGATATRVGLRIQELVAYLAQPLGAVREWVTT